MDFEFLRELVNIYARENDVSLRQRLFLSAIDKYTRYRKAYFIVVKIFNGIGRFFGKGIGSTAEELLHNAIVSNRRLHERTEELLHSSTESKCARVAGFVSGWPAAGSPAVSVHGPQSTVDSKASPQAGSPAHSPEIARVTSTRPQATNSSAMSYALRAMRHRASSRPSNSSPAGEGVLPRAEELRFLALGTEASGSSPAARREGPATRKTEDLQWYLRLLRLAFPPLYRRFVRRGVIEFHAQVESLAEEAGVPFEVTHEDVRRVILSMEREKEVIAGLPAHWQDFWRDSGLDRGQELSEEAVAQHPNARIRALALPLYRLRQAVRNTGEQQNLGIITAWCQEEILTLQQWVEGNEKIPAEMLTLGNVFAPEFFELLFSQFDQEELILETELRAIFTEIPPDYLFKEREGGSAGSPADSTEDTEAVVADQPALSTLHPEAAVAKAESEVSRLTGIASNHLSQLQGAANDIETCLAERRDVETELRAIQEDGELHTKEIRVSQEQLIRIAQRIISLQGKIRHLRDEIGKLAERYPDIQQIKEIRITTSRIQSNLESALNPTPPIDLVSNQGQNLLRCLQAVNELIGVNQETIASAQFKLHQTRSKHKSTTLWEGRIAKHRKKEEALHQRRRELLLEIHKFAELHPEVAQGLFGGQLLIEASRISAEESAYAASSPANAHSLPDMLNIYERAVIDNFPNSREIMTDIRAGSYSISSVHSNPAGMFRNTPLNRLLKSLLHEEDILGTWGLVTCLAIIAIGLNKEDIFSASILHQHLLGALRPGWWNEGDIHDVYEWFMANEETRKYMPPEYREWNPHRTYEEYIHGRAREIVEMLLQLPQVERKILIALYHESAEPHVNQIIQALKPSLLDGGIRMLFLRRRGGLPPDKLMVSNISIAESINYTPTVVTTRYGVAMKDATSQDWTNRKTVKHNLVVLRPSDIPALLGEDGMRVIDFDNCQEVSHRRAAGSPARPAALRSSSNEIPGERLWQLMSQGKETTGLTKKVMPTLSHSGGLELGVKMYFGDLVIIWPFRGLISGDINMADIYPQEFYVMPIQEAQKMLNDQSYPFYYELTDEQVAMIKSYIAQRPDRYLARVEWPYSGRALPLARDYWPRYYAGLENQGSQQLNARIHPFVVERMIKAIEQLRKSGQTHFNILQEGCGDARLLLLTRKALKKQFPNLRFLFFGVDKQADEIAIAVHRKRLPVDVRVRTGLAEDDTLWGEAAETDFFNVILDYGLTVKGIIKEGQADAIYQKWSRQLKAGGLVFSIPAGPSWIYSIPLPLNLTILSHCLPELHFAHRAPRIFITLQKNGGYPVSIHELFNDITYPIDQQHSGDVPKKPTPASRHRVLSERWRQVWPAVREWLRKGNVSERELSHMDSYATFYPGRLIDYMENPLRIVRDFVMAHLRASYAQRVERYGGNVAQQIEQAIYNTVEGLSPEGVWQTTLPDLVSALEQRMLQSRLLLIRVIKEAVDERRKAGLPDTALLSTRAALESRKEAAASSPATKKHVVIIPKHKHLERATWQDRLGVLDDEFGQWRLLQPLRYDTFNWPYEWEDLKDLIRGLKEVERLAQEMIIQMTGIESLPILRLVTDTSMSHFTYIMRFIADNPPGMHMLLKSISVDSIEPLFHNFDDYDGTTEIGGKRFSTYLPSLCVGDEDLLLEEKVKLLLAIFLQSQWYDLFVWLTQVSQEQRDAVLKSIEMVHMKLRRGIQWYLMHRYPYVQAFKLYRHADHREFSGGSTVTLGERRYFGPSSAELEEYGLFSIRILAPLDSVVWYKPSRDYVEEYVIEAGTYQRLHSGSPATEELSHRSPMFKPVLLVSSLAGAPPTVASPVCLAKSGGRIVEAVINPNYKTYVVADPLFSLLEVGRQQELGGIAIPLGKTKGEDIIKIEILFSLVSILEDAVCFVGSRSLLKLVRAKNAIFFRASAILNPEVASPNSILVHTPKEAVKSLIWEERLHLAVGRLPESEQGKLQRQLEDGIQKVKNASPHPEDPLRRKLHRIVVKIIQVVESEHPPEEIAEEVLMKFVYVHSPELISQLVEYTFGPDAAECINKLLKETSPSEEEILEVLQAAEMIRPYVNEPAYLTLLKEENMHIAPLVGLWRWLRGLPHRLFPRFFILSLLAILSLGELIGRLPVTDVAQLQATPLVAVSESSLRVGSPADLAKSSLVYDLRAYKLNSLSANNTAPATNRGGSDTSCVGSSPAVETSQHWLSQRRIWDSLQRMEYLMERAKAIAVESKPAEKYQREEYVRQIYAIANAFTLLDLLLLAESKDCLTIYNRLNNWLLSQKLAPLRYATLLMLPYRDELTLKEAQWSLLEQTGRLLVLLHQIKMNTQQLRRTKETQAWLLLRALDAAIGWVTNPLNGFTRFKKWCEGIQKQPGAMTQQEAIEYLNELIDRLNNSFAYVESLYARYPNWAEPIGISRPQQDSEELTKLNAQIAKEVDATAVRNLAAWKETIQWRLKTGSELFAEAKVILRQLLQLREQVVSVLRRTTSSPIVHSRVSSFATVTLKLSAASSPAPLSLTVNPLVAFAPRCLPLTGQRHTVSGSRSTVNATWHLPASEGASSPATNSTTLRNRRLNIALLGRIAGYLPYEIPSAIIAEFVAKYYKWYPLIQKEHAPPTIQYFLRYFWEKCSARDPRIPEVEIVFREFYDGDGYLQSSLKIKLNGVIIEEPKTSGRSVKTGDHIFVISPLISVPQLGQEIGVDVQRLLGCIEHGYPQPDVSVQRGHVEYYFDPARIPEICAGLQIFDPAEYILMNELAQEIGVNEDKIITTVKERHLSPDITMRQDDKILYFFKRSRIQEISWIIKPDLKSCINARQLAQRIHVSEYRILKAIKHGELMPDHEVKYGKGKIHYFKRSRTPEIRKKLKPFSPKGFISIGKLPKRIHVSAAKINKAIKEERLHTDLELKHGKHSYKYFKNSRIREIRRMLKPNLAGLICAFKLMGIIHVNREAISKAIKDDVIVPDLELLRGKFKGRYFKRSRIPELRQKLKSVDYKKYISASRLAHQIGVRENSLLQIGPDLVIESGKRTYRYFRRIRSWVREVRRMLKPDLTGLIISAKLAKRIGVAEATVARAIKQKRLEPNKIIRQGKNTLRYFQRSRILEIRRLLRPNLRGYVSAFQLAHIIYISYEVIRKAIRVYRQQYAPAQGLRPDLVINRGRNTAFYFKRSRIPAMRKQFRLFDPRRVYSVRKIAEILQVGSGGISGALRRREIVADFTVKQGNRSLYYFRRSRERIKELKKVLKPVHLKGFCSATELADLLGVSRASVSRAINTTKRLIPDKTFRQGKNPYHYFRLTRLEEIRKLFRTSHKNIKTASSPMQKTEGSMKRLDRESRIRQIESFVTQCGGAVTDVEVAEHLGLKVRTLRVKKEGVDLDKYGLISAQKLSLATGVSARGKSAFMKSEAACKYLIFKLMFLELGLLNLIAWHKQLKDKARTEELDTKERECLEDIEKGFLNLANRLRALKVPPSGKGYPFLYTQGIDYRLLTQGHIESALRMLDEKNWIAASGAFVAALIYCLDKELEAYAQQKRIYPPRVRFWRQRRTGEYKLRVGRFVNFKVAKGEFIPLLVYRIVSFALRWQAAQAVDHAIDFELDEIGYITDYLALIEKIRQKISEAKSQEGLLDTETSRRFKEEIETVIMKLNPRWIMEKFFAQCALGIAAGLIKIGQISYADALLGMTKGFFQRRKQESFRIIKGLELGLQREMRRAIREQNAEISANIENVLKSRRPELALGLSQRRDINNEPEFQNLSSIFAWLAAELQKGKDADPEKIQLAIRRARRRMTDVRLLYDFMVRFREAYKQTRLSGQPPTCRYEVFNKTYQDFAKENNLVRGSPYLRIKCAQAALPISLKIDDPQNPQEQIDNPAFMLISACALIQYSRLLNLKRIPGLSKERYPLTRALLEKFVGEKKPYFYMLGSEERRAIVEELIKDIYMQGEQFTLFGAALFNEHRTAIEQALELFLNPDLSDCAEMSSEVLSAIRQSAARITNLLAHRTEENILQAKKIIEETDERYFGHLHRLPLSASSETIAGKLWAIKGELAGKRRLVLPAMERTGQLIRQIDGILSCRLKAEESPATSSPAVRKPSQFQPTLEYVQCLIQAAKKNTLGTQFASEVETAVKLVLPDGQNPTTIKERFGAYALLIVRTFYKGPLAENAQLIEAIKAQIRADIQAISTGQAFTAIPATTFPVAIHNQIQRLRNDLRPEEKIPALTLVGQLPLAIPRDLAYLVEIFRELSADWSYPERCPVVFGVLRNLQGIGKTSSREEMERVVAANLRYLIHRLELPRRIAERLVEAVCAKGAASSPAELKSQRIGEVQVEFFSLTSPEERRRWKINLRTLDQKFGPYSSENLCHVGAWIKTQTERLFRKEGVLGDMGQQRQLQESAILELALDATKLKAFCTLLDKMIKRTEVFDLVEAAANQKGGNLDIQFRPDMPSPFRISQVWSLNMRLDTKERVALTLYALSNTEDVRCQYAKLLTAMALCKEGKQGYILLKLRELHDKYLLAVRWSLMHTLEYVTAIRAWRGSESIICGEGEALIAPDPEYFVFSQEAARENAGAIQVHLPIESIVGCTFSEEPRVLAAQGRYIINSVINKPVSSLVDTSDGDLSPSVIGYINEVLPEDPDDLELMQARGILVKVGRGVLDAQSAIWEIIAILGVYKDDLAKAGQSVRHVAHIPVRQSLAYNQLTWEEGRLISKIGSRGIGSVMQTEPWSGSGRREWAIEIVSRILIGYLRLDKSVPELISLFGLTVAKIKELENLALPHRTQGPSLPERPSFSLWVNELGYLLTNRTWVTLIKNRVCTLGQLLEESEYFDNLFNLLPRFGHQAFQEIERLREIMGRPPMRLKQDSWPLVRQAFRERQRYLQKASVGMPQGIFGNSASSPASSSIALYERVPSSPSSSPLRCEGPAHTSDEASSPTVRSKEENRIGLLNKLDRTALLTLFMPLPVRHRLDIFHVDRFFQAKQHKGTDFTSLDDIKEQLCSVARSTKRGGAYLSDTIPLIMAALRMILEENRLDNFDLGQVERRPGVLKIINEAIAEASKLQVLFQGALEGNEPHTKAIAKHIVSKLKTGVSEMTELLTAISNPVTFVELANFLDKLVKYLLSSGMEVTFNNALQVIQQGTLKSSGNLTPGAAASSPAAIYKNNAALIIVHANELPNSDPTHVAKSSIEQLLAHPGVTTVYEADGHDSYLSHSGQRFIGYVSDEPFQRQSPAPEMILILVGGNLNVCLHKQFEYLAERMTQETGTWEIHLPFGGPIYARHQQAEFSVHFSIVGRYIDTLLHNIGSLRKLEDNQDCLVYIAKDTEIGLEIRLVVWKSFAPLLQYLNESTASSPAASSVNSSNFFDPSSISLKNIFRAWLTLFHKINALPNAQDILTAGGGSYDTEDFSIREVVFVIETERERYCKWDGPFYDAHGITQDGYLISGGRHITTILEELSSEYGMKRVLFSCCNTDDGRVELSEGIEEAVFAGSDVCATYPRPDLVLDAASLGSMPLREETYLREEGQWLLQQLRRLGDVLNFLRPAESSNATCVFATHWNWITRKKKPLHLKQISLPRNRLNTKYSIINTKVAASSPAASDPAPFPGPSLTEEFPYSYLNRHRWQWEYLRKYALPVLFERAREREKATGQLRLRILVLGAGTGEELARSFHEVIQLLTQLGENPKQWQLEINGIDSSDERVAKGQKRLVGEEPFVWYYLSLFDTEFPGARKVSEEYAESVIQTLNAHRDLARSSLKLEASDIRNLSVLEHYADADLVLVNEVLYLFTIETVIRVLSYLDSWAQAWLAIAHFDGPWLWSELLSQLSPLRHQLKTITFEGCMDLQTMYHGSVDTSTYYIFGAPVEDVSAETVLAPPAASSPAVTIGNIDLLEPLRNFREITNVEWQFIQVQIKNRLSEVLSRRGTREYVDLDFEGESLGSVNTRLGDKEIRFRRDLVSPNTYIFYFPQWKGQRMDFATVTVSIKADANRSPERVRIISVPTESWRTKGYGDIEVHASVRLSFIEAIHKGLDQLINFSRESGGGSKPILLGKVYLEGSRTTYRFVYLEYEGKEVINRSTTRVKGFVYVDLLFGKRADIGEVEVELSVSSPDTAEQSPSSPVSLNPFRRVGGTVAAASSPADKGSRVQADVRTFVDNIRSRAGESIVIVVRQGKKTAVRYTGKGFELKGHGEHLIQSLLDEQARADLVRLLRAFLNSGTYSKLRPLIWHLLAYAEPAKTPISIKGIKEPVFSSRLLTLVDSGRVRYVISKKQWSIVSSPTEERNTHEAIRNTRNAASSPEDIYSSVSDSNVLRAAFGLFTPSWILQKLVVTPERLSTSLIRPDGYLALRSYPVIDEALRYVYRLGLASNSRELKVSDFKNRDVLPFNRKGVLRRLKG